MMSKAWFISADERMIAPRSRIADWKSRYVATEFTTRCCRQVRKMAANSIGLHGPYLYGPPS